MESTVLYFEERGKKNTQRTLQLAKKRALELEIDRVLVASTHGYSALQAAEVFGDTDVGVVAVSISPSFDDMGWTMTDAERSRVEAAGVKVLTGLHALADGVPEGFYGEKTPGTIVAETLRFFSQGMKVAVEISVMALEAGLVDPGTEVVSVGGTDEGVDTAIVARPSFARHIKEYRVLELLCKPRQA
jgi:hypothetical protein